MFGYFCLEPYDEVVIIIEYCFVISHFFNYDILLMFEEDVRCHPQLLYCSQVIIILYPDSLNCLTTFTHMYLLFSCVLVIHGWSLKEEVFVRYLLTQLPSTPPSI